MLTCFAALSSGEGAGEPNAFTEMMSGSTAGFAAGLETSADIEADLSKLHSWS